MTKAPEKFGELTWSLVREAYLRGMKAGDCEKLYGPKAGTIRARARRKGWTRKAHARELDELRARAAPQALPFPSGNAALGEAIPHPTPHFWASESEIDEKAPLDPETVLREAAVAARRAIARGRPAEAASLIKAAEALAALSRRIDAEAKTVEAARPPTQAERDAAELDLYEAIYKEAFKLAGHIGAELLAPDARPCATVSRFVYEWRARNMEPRVTQEDFARARKGGWWAHVFNADGTVKPVTFEDVAKAMYYDWPPAGKV